ncbi:M23 family metallopeptidase [Cyanobium sp. NIES-981]|uniref:M23 family metallopeptidase n=1 Tax=Cyanobium sp. NIES-981 TaxID=1851505 RepID=UPI0007DE3279|nr:M23 family metallopeptidase [Cyanobium sp. NIES-981]SBO43023.1 Peptidase family M23/M37 [Cyanobium sp. NIES-981]
MARSSLLRALPLALAASAPLLGLVGLGVAQERAAIDPPSPAPAPVPAAAQPEPADPPARPAAPAQVQAPSLRPGVPPVAPARSQRPASPPQPGPEPTRFDRSLDALVRDGIVTPAERDRVRAGARSTPFDVPAHAKACSNGALSAQECRSGVVVRWRGRPGPDAGLAPGGMAGNAGQGLIAGRALATPLTVPVSALLAGAGGGFRLADVFSVTPRPAPISGNGNRTLLFPLIGSAITSSGFGYRLHPVLGSWLMHAGRDLAAPEGTPVVAALSGTVISSGAAGGYGLAIELEHPRPRRRTLYGHLSELYVKPGDRVLQGEVIGRVGSTGLSTGPHLHFELRVPGEGGWLAVDPGDLDPGQAAAGSDAIALLMGQLLQSLERPVSPLLRPAQPAAASAG